ncbi:tetratricopeptide repeat protein [Streptomyces albipurpureus]|uniref:Tetratricopeptide repeat protein n=1 Tax=Streptomyces albipurpureus TaxID=2897419 RepID=A0ABT0UJ69_9ACTN|nr:tetratricopeptide repeat protein [Streptomyces sp. CWNU-1]MCM2388292.1 tetratricopeptide repeat protein [Streptomyces sp. CWNU-1]
MAIGSTGQVNYHAAPRTPAGWPRQVGVIPSRAQSFRHRAQAGWLRSTVGGAGALGQVLTGMGGVGKTQLAADYARTAWQNGSLDVLVWVTASTRWAVVTGYAQAGIELCLAEPGDPELAARTFLAWLTPKAGARPCRWLIVLDDLADPDDLRGLWPPADPNGRTLVTTRRRDAALAGGDRRRIEVGLFTEAEAVAYLTHSLATHGRHAPADQLTALTRDLGRLPLALSQATAYLIDSGDDVTTYRSLLADRATTLADTAPDQLPDEQALPLFAAWSLCIDRADTLRPAGLARPMLHLAALLDPHGIPQTVLTSPPVLNHLTRHRTRTHQAGVGEPGPVSHRDAVRALRALHRLSLIDHTPDTPHQAVRVHQLIQRATRDTLTPDQHDQLTLIAADSLTTAWPDIERDTTLTQALRANTTALARTAEDALYRPAPHALLLRIGTSLGESGRLTAARDHFEHLATTTRQHIGPDHPDTLNALQAQAHWQAIAGDPDGAVAAFGQLLPDFERVLGPDHPNTLCIRLNLAYWRGEAGDPAGAATAFEQISADCERALGPDHIHTLTARKDIALWQGVTGDAAGAAAAFEQVSADCERILGPDHLYTLTTRSYLARWQGEADSTAGAAAFAQLLANWERVQGPDHPDILTARRDLAVLYGLTGDAVGTAAAFEQVSADCERLLGPDHPDTLTTRDHLARQRLRTQKRYC